MVLSPRRFHILSSWQSILIIKAGYLGWIGLGRWVVSGRDRGKSPVVFSCPFGVQLMERATSWVWNGIWLKTHTDTCVSLEPFSPGYWEEEHWEVLGHSILILKALYHILAALWNISTYTELVITCRNLQGYALSLSLFICLSLSLPLSLLLLYAHTEARGGQWVYSFTRLHLIFEDWVFYWPWSMTCQLIWLPSKLSGPSCLQPLILVL